MATNKSKEFASQALTDFYRRDVDQKSPSLTTTIVHADRSLADLTNKVIRDNLKVNSIKRQEFTAKIMSKLSDITAANVFEKDYKFASKFPSGADKKIIKRYKVWIKHINEINRPPKTFGSAYLRNKSFANLNDSQLDQLAKDTSSIQELKTAYIEYQPGVSNGFNEFPDIGDEVQVFTTEPELFDDVKIIRILSKVQGAYSLNSATIKNKSNPKVGLSRQQLLSSGVAAGANISGINVPATADSVLAKLRANPNATLTAEEQRILDASTFAGNVGFSRDLSFNEQTNPSKIAQNPEKAVQTMTTEDVLESLSKG